MVVVGRLEKQHQIKTEAQLFLASVFSFCRHSIGGGEEKFAFPELCDIIGD